MADITLADYTGYIFIEIIKAREMADQHSRRLAEVYARDPVLQHFSVPRFKVPKMELTIPVLISGARFKQVIVFDLPQDKFVAYVMGKVKAVISAVKSRLDDPFKRAVKTLQGRTEAASDITLDQLAQVFWQSLKDNPDPAEPGEVVQKYWTQMFEQALLERNLMDAYKKTNPNNELYRQSLDEVHKAVTTATVVNSTTIQSLLINPETNVVKNGSSETSVFTLKAELLEEGFFIRQIKDEASGQTRPVVEFE